LINQCIIWNGFILCIIYIKRNIAKYFIQSITWKLKYVKFNDYSININKFICTSSDTTVIFFVYHRKEIIASLLKSMFFLSISFSSSFHNPYFSSTYCVQYFLFRVLCLPKSMKSVHNIWNTLCKELKATLSTCD